MKKAPSPSTQTQQEALNIAKATQKPGQTKEQTKLIAQGIEKGIAVYKKQQKEKQRQADKNRKKQNREKQNRITESEIPSSEQTEPRQSQPDSHKLLHILPWFLAITSWAILAGVLLTH